MHGRIIAGIGYTDPEITRIEAALANAKRTTPGTFTKSTYIRQLEQILEQRKRMNQRRDALASTANNPTDALDVLNARAEARDLAERMKAAGYTQAQIQATVTPMLVNPDSTITGRKERREARRKRREERKKAGKGIFRKIGNAIKKGASFVYKGAAKLNPVLAAARVATLSLVAKNAGGLADSMRKAGADKMRRKWENLGGDFAKLQQAVEKGSGQRITGIFEYEELPGSMQPNQVIGVAPVAAATGISKLWEVAKPIIEQLLRAVGIRVSKEVEKALDVPDSEETKAVRAQAEDALNPETGDGPGSNGGTAISPLVLGGLAALLIFATRK